MMPSKVAYVVEMVARRIKELRALPMVKQVN